MILLDQKVLPNFVVLTWPKADHNARWYIELTKPKCQCRRKILAVPFAFIEQKIDDRINLPIDLSRQRKTIREVGSVGQILFKQNRLRELVTLDGLTCRQNRVAKRYDRLERPRKVLIFIQWKGAIIGLRSVEIRTR